MALRLTGTTSAETPDSGGIAPAPSGGGAVVELGVRARAALAQGELGRYRELFAQAGRLEDPQRVYQARLGLLAGGLEAAAGRPRGEALEGYLTVARLAVGMLESEPSEPLVLSHAAVAFHELWCPEAAEELFAAARRLEPGLPHVEEGQRAAAARLRASRGRAPLHPALAPLARRARAAAGRAQPSCGLKLSLCMIVRDEERMLPRCLEVVADAVDEIVIVDTGSTDATVKIARSFGARVIERPWTGSFAEARNASLEAATGDWVLYLDADEVVEPADARRLRELCGQAWHEAFYLVMTSHTGEEGDGAAVTNNVLRMFRNRPQYRFEGRIHEQIADRLPSFAPGRIAQTTIRVQHYGYLGAVREAKEKSARNLELLRAQQRESEPTAFLHFNLGSEYAASGQPLEAAAELTRAWALLQREGGVRSCVFAVPLLVRLSQALRATDRVAEAEAVIDRGLGLFGQLTDLVYERACCARDRGDRAAAMAGYERCLELGEGDAAHGAAVGAGSWKPRLAIADLHLSAGRAAAALEVLQACWSAHPGLYGTVRPYVTALLAAGRSPVEAVAEIERGTGSLDAVLRLPLAVALHRAGALPDAEEQYRALLRERPEHAEARVGLAEVLLYRGSFEEAAEQAAQVGEEDPFAALACRIELCGAIAAERPEPARAALARAVRVGVPAAEREVFSRWAALSGVRDGATPLTPVPVAGVPILAVIMEALLRAGASERFNATVPLLEDSSLDRREQRELIADLFLRTGRLADAARVWMAAHSEQPDARALLGLARVSERLGSADDAANFAAGALELDPTCAAASEILARHREDAMAA